MSILPSEVAEKGYTHFLERWARECPNNQFLREFSKNGIQAIFRKIEDTKNPNYKGVVEIDVDWLTYDLTKTYKMTISDNGIGMTGSEMIEYIKDLASSSDVTTDYDNYGFGAKISAVVKNKKGIKYDSWKNGFGVTAVFLYDPISKKYGLKQFAEEGEYKYFTPITDDIKPDFIKDSGTVVTLFGNDDSDNTYDMEYHGIKATRESWVVSYLNRRFNKLPENIEIRARLGHYRDKTGEGKPQGDDSKYNYMAVIGGLQNSLEKYTIQKGIVDLSDAKIEWRIMKQDRKSHGREFLTGHTAVVLEDEVFDVSIGSGNKAINFGVYVGAQDVVLHILPKTKNYFQNNTRSAIVMNGEEDLPWEKWQSEFQNKFPKELETYLSKKMSEFTNEDESDKIKDKLKDLRKFFVVSKYKKSPTGKFLVNEEDLSEANTGSGSGKSKGGKNGTGTKPGYGIGLLDALVSIQKRDDGKVRANPATPDPFPNITWVDPETTDLIEKSEIKDRAAIYREQKHLILANATFNGFLDVQKHFCEEYPGLPEENIIKVVQNVFGQQLIETIAGTIHLKNRADWDHNDYKTAISPEALTVAVSARYHFFQSIKRMLKNPTLRAVNETSQSENVAS